MALLLAQQVAVPSLLPVFVAAAGGGDTVAPGDTEFVVVKNASGASINVTISSYPDTSPWGTAIPDMVVAVAAGTERWIGPLRGSSFMNPSTGLVGITYSAVASVTVGAFQV